MDDKIDIKTNVKIQDAKELFTLRYFQVIKSKFQRFKLLKSVLIIYEKSCLKLMHRNRYSFVLSMKQAKGQLGKKIYKTSEKKQYFTL